MKVAVAIITDNQQRILITKRPLHVAHGEMWEFPGGKLELNESPEKALIREIKEEVGLDVMDYVFLGNIHHAYASKPISFFLYHVTQFCGQAICREAQTDLCWVDRASLGKFTFPEANKQFIDLYISITGK